MSRLPSEKQPSRGETGATVHLTVPQRRFNNDKDSRWKFAEVRNAPARLSEAPPGKLARVPVCLVRGEANYRYRKKR